MFRTFWEFAFLYKALHFLGYPKNGRLSIKSAILTVENVVHKVQAICAFCSCFMLTSVHCQLVHMVLGLRSCIQLPSNDHKTFGKLYLAQYSVLFVPEL